MAHTEIFISNDAGTLVPSQPSVAVSSGDTVAFSVSDAGPVVAFFSPGAATLLSPAPKNPLLLNAKGPTVFTFTTSETGSYSVFFETSVNAAVPDFPVAKSNLLQLEIDTDGVGFGGPTTHTRGG